MNRLYLILTSFYLIATCQAAEITIGTKLNDVMKAMKVAGYTVKDDPYPIPEIAFSKPLKVWNFGEGLFYVVYSWRTKKITAMAYCPAGFPSKAQHVELDVKTVNTDTGVVVIQTKKPKKKVKD